MITKGHWPRGKRRHAAAPDVMRDLRDAYREVGSLRVIAKLVGVDHRTVNRWLKGEDRPAPEHVETLRKRFGFGRVEG